MEPELLIFLTAVVGLATAVILMWRDVRGARHDVRIVHDDINGRMDELLELTRKAAHAAGVEEGKDRPSSRE